MRLMICLLNADSAFFTASAAAEFTFSIQALLLTSMYSLTNSEASSPAILLMAVLMSFTAGSLVMAARTAATA